LNKISKSLNIFKLTNGILDQHDLQKSGNHSSTNKREEGLPFAPQDLLKL